MSYLTITSKNNDRVKRVCLLAASPVQRRKQGLFVLEGLRLCRDAAQNGVRASEVYFRKDVADKFSDDLNLLINSADSAFLVGDDVFEKMSATESSQGVISVIDASALPNGCEPSASGRYVACENIADPSNLGAIARTAEALIYGDDESARDQDADRSDGIGEHLHVVAAHRETVLRVGS